MRSSGVTADGRFRVGIHRPWFRVANLRSDSYPAILGTTPDGTPVDNQRNFPQGDVTEPSADRIFEIPNPFPFKGVTYINSAWADKNAENPENIHLPKPREVSFLDKIKKQAGNRDKDGTEAKALLKALPRPLALALADTSTDPEELVLLAETTCTFILDNKKRPTGILFKKTGDGRLFPDIQDHTLYEILANNPHLPDDYKRVMVLMPGIQGNSEITGEWKEKKSHVFEYLRRNSYIPWGHFAANTAHDTVRYSIQDLSYEDMTGMRHLFCQRIYVRLARELGIPVPGSLRILTEAELENLRINIMKALSQGQTLKFTGSLWGWNFGFGYAQSGYRLHASHQQIHQQYAMIPETVTENNGDNFPSYACGDLVADFLHEYRRETGTDFFPNLIRAIRSNTRTDGREERESSLILFEDNNVILYVPKAQTSQWELQLMPLTPCGNILEADTSMRHSLDLGILTALRVLEKLGACMVTSIEYAKRFNEKEADQHLIYAFLPKIPESPGAFSEAQLRWINGHYPEDFALACRQQLKNQNC